jgi:hypothetical protein
MLVLVIGLIMALFWPKHVADFLEKQIAVFGPNTGYTQKSGAVSILFTFETAPLFCVCSVLCF